MSLPRGRSIGLVPSCRFESPPFPLTTFHTPPRPAILSTRHVILFLMANHHHRQRSRSFFQVNFLRRRDRESHTHVERVPSEPCGPPTLTAADAICFGFCRATFLRQFSTIKQSMTLFENHHNGIEPIETKRRFSAQAACLGENRYCQILMVPCAVCFFSVRSNCRAILVAGVGL